MDDGNLLLRSSVKSTMKRFVLFRGTFLAGLGAALMLFTGAFLPRGTLALWGLLCFGIGLGLITLGLLPYRRLTRLENKPFEILLSQGLLSFISKGIKKFSVPFASIEKTGFVDDRHQYGICLWLKKPAQEKVIVHDPGFDMAAFQNKSKAKHGCDLFLPYFSKRSYEEMRDFQDIETHDDSLT